MNRLHQLLSQPKAVRRFEIDYLTNALFLDDDLVGLSIPNSGEQKAAKVWLKGIQFPAASERLGSAPAQACDVTRRGDSSCREVPDGSWGSDRPVPPGEFFGGGR